MYPLSLRGEKERTGAVLVYKGPAKIGYFVPRFLPNELG